MKKNTIISQEMNILNYKRHDSFSEIHRMSKYAQRYSIYNNQHKK